MHAHKHYVFVAATASNNYHTDYYQFSKYVTLSVSVCVCVCERERERESLSGNLFLIRITNRERESTQETKVIPHFHSIASWIMVANKVKNYLSIWTIIGDVSLF